MNGFLVVLRHSIDDMSLLLVDSHDEAVAAAKLVGPDDGEHIKSLLSIDCDTPVAVWVYAFRGGQMVEAEKVKEFD